MLKIANDVSSITVSGGEPFLVEVQLRDHAGVVVDPGAREFAFYFSASGRAIKAEIDGERLVDDSGPFLRFARDGTFTNSLVGKPLMVELVERLKNGHDLYAAGVLTVANSATGIASNDAAPIGRTAVRLTAHLDEDGVLASWSQERVPFVVDPDPTPTVLVSSLAGLHGDSDVETGGGTDDTAVLQPAIDELAGTDTTLVFDCACLVTGLVQPSGSRIACLNDDCGIYLADGSNRPALRNENRQRIEAARHLTEAEKAALDHDISWIGGTINGNQDGQSYFEGGRNTGGFNAADSLNHAVTMYGVHDCTIDAKIIYPRLYSINAATAYDSIFINRGMKVKLDGNGVGTSVSPVFNVPINQDGVHINGPAQNIEIEFYGQSWDDAVSITADDGSGDMVANSEFGPYVGAGPIDNVTAKARPGDALFGVRLLSKTSPVSNVTIDCLGSVHGHGLTIGGYQSGGNGQFSGIRFTQLDLTSNNGSRVYAPQQNQPFMSIDGTFADELLFDKLVRHTNNTTGPVGRLIDIKDGAVIPSFRIKDLAIDEGAGYAFDPADDSPVQIKRGNASVDLRIDKLRYTRDATATPAGMAVVGLRGGSGGFQIEDAVTSRIGNVLAWLEGTLAFNRANNVTLNSMDSGGSYVYVGSGTVGTVTSGYTTNITPASPIATGPNAANFFPSAPPAYTNYVTGNSTGPFNQPTSTYSWDREPAGGTGEDTPPVVTDNFGNGPDGPNTAAKISLPAQTGASNSFLSRRVELAGAGTYNVSAWVKGLAVGQRHAITVLHSDTFAQVAYTTFQPDSVNGGYVDLDFDWDGNGFVFITFGTSPYGGNPQTGLTGGDFLFTRAQITSGNGRKPFVAS